MTLLGVRVKRRDLRFCKEKIENLGQNLVAKRVIDN